MHPVPPPAPPAGEQPLRGFLQPLRSPEHCPPEVAELQARCVRTEPSERPSAAELVQELRRLQRQASPAASRGALEDGLEESAELAGSCPVSGEGFSGDAAQPAGSAQQDSNGSIGAHGTGAASPTSRPGIGAGGDNMATAAAAAAPGEAHPKGGLKGEGSGQPASPTGVLLSGGASMDRQSWSGANSGHAGSDEVERPLGPTGAPAAPQPAPAPGSPDLHSSSGFDSASDPLSAPVRRAATAQMMPRFSSPFELMQRTGGAGAGAGTVLKPMLPQRFSSPFELMRGGAAAPPPPPLLPRLPGSLELRRRAPAGAGYAPEPEASSSPSCGLTQASSGEASFPEVHTAALPARYCSASPSS